MLFDFLRPEKELLTYTRAKQLFVYSLLILNGGLTFSGNLQALTFTKLGAYNPVDLKGNILISNDGSTLGAIDIKSGGAITLADKATAIPKGAGNFTTFFFNNGISYGSIEGDKFIFEGAGDYQQFGLYSVPIAGGTISMIVNQGTLLPGLPAPNQSLGSQKMLPFSANSTHSVFKIFTSSINNAYSVDNATGIVTPLFTSSPSIIGQSCIFSYMMADIAINDSGTVALMLADAFPLKPSLILSGSFNQLNNINLGCSRTSADFGGLAIVATDTVTPGSEPNPRSFTSEILSSVRSDGDTFVFTGYAAPINIPGVNNTTIDLYGLYSSIGGKLYKLVDSKTPIPGGNGSFTGLNQLHNYSNNYSYVVKGNRVLLKYADTNGLYVVSTKGEALTKIIAKGDSFDDKTVISVGSYALDGDSLAVNIETNDVTGTYTNTYLTNLAGGGSSAPGTTPSPGGSIDTGTGGTNGSGTSPLGIGAQLTFTGQGYGFGKGKLVVGNKAAKVLLWSDTNISAVIPNLKAGNQAVRAYNKKGKLIFTSSITVLAPALTGLSRNTVSKGNTLTITGSALGTTKPKVYFVSARGKKTSVVVLKGFNNTTVAVKLPNLAVGTYQVLLNNAAGNSNNLSIQVQ